MKTVLAIDPGREKCGLAVVSDEDVLHRGVVSRDEVVRVALALAAAHSVDRIIVGGGTGGTALVEELRAAGGSSESGMGETVPGGRAFPIEVVDEAHSTRRARARFFEENPPRGIRRLIPRGLLTPDRPYDDCVALALAEDYLRQA